MAAPTQSQLFQPYRSVGHVTTAVPFALNKMGQAFFATASVGRAFQVYNVRRTEKQPRPLLSTQHKHRGEWLLTPLPDPCGTQCDKLRLVLVSPPGRDPITALAAAGETTFVACGPRVHVWKRLELLHTLVGHTADVHHLLVFGPHILSVAADATLRVWDWAVGGAATAVVELPAGERVTALMHPDTYLNKVIVAYARCVRGKGWEEQHSLSFLFFPFPTHTHATFIARNRCVMSALSPGCVRVSLVV